MQIINAPVVSEYEVKKSKFISHLVPIGQFESREKELRALHPKASHFVTASRRINAFDQVVESFSDDGEPKGVAGMPTLKAMQGADLVNAAVITVRYFGGIKLGTGGMARAYADAANLAITSAELREYIKPFAQRVTLAYSDLSRLEYLVANTPDAVMTDKQFGSEEVSVEISGRESSVRSVIERLHAT